jgi:hypothetical protein
MSDFLTVNNTVFNTWFEIVNGKELVNLKRLAEAFGKSNKDCIEILTKSQELFKGTHFEFSGMIPQNSQNPLNGKHAGGRPQKDHYLTRDGCLAFINLLDYNRYDPDVSRFIIEFQKWLIKTAGERIDGKLISSEYVPIAPVLKDQMKIASVMISIGVEKSVAHVMAISTTEDILQCGEMLTPWKNLISTDLATTEPPLLTPTDIGKHLSLSAQTVNGLLKTLGFQDKINEVWVPTDVGREYCNLIPQEILHNHGMVRKLQIKWKPSIIPVLEEKLFFNTEQSHLLEES